jgi:probable HAF family extracellular repeat protein
MKVTAAAALLALLVSAQAQQQSQQQPKPRYNVTAIAVPGALSTKVGAINNRGQIAGTYETADYQLFAFVYYNNQIQTLGKGSPLAINNHGQLVGLAGLPIMPVL